ncbi:MAG: hypothetical protein IIB78_07630, partial [Proteobacteria bacterium]|nr:hypothetical protein [Pseudomonadota bacterium]
MQVLADQGHASRQSSATDRNEQVIDGSDSSGNRVRLVGYSEEILEDDDYSGIPDDIILVPGDSTSMIDRVDLSPEFLSFIHAPFKDDFEADRNDTSIAMQVTLTDGDQTCRALLLGDLSNPTVRRIFDISEADSVAWNLLLAPHHCSKTVMYTKDDNDEDELDSELMGWFEEAGGAC